MDLVEDTNANKLDELSGLLKESIAMCKEDRKMAIENYKDLRDQLDSILARDMESSEDGKVEAEVNKALKLVFESGKRMENVISAITKILVTQLANESREKVAANIFGGGNFNPHKQIVNQPVDLNKLLED